MLALAVSAMVAPADSSSASLTRSRRLAGEVDSSLREQAEGQNSLAYHFCKPKFTRKPPLLRSKTPFIPFFAGKNFFSLFLPFFWTFFEIYLYIPNSKDQKCLFWGV
ncbi:MAG: hypothetical protein IKJ76_06655, partial [Fibrobacter sp.]|nr:hypothetical protein [Fibrobacter sp.]